MTPHQKIKANLVKWIESEIEASKVTIERCRAGESEGGRDRELFNEGVVYGLQSVLRAADKIL